MPQNALIITLSVQETGSQGVCLYHVRVDEEVVASNQPPSQAASQTMRDISRQYNQMFEERYTPRLALKNLQILGAVLFSTLLAPVWEQVTTKVSSSARRLLVIASDVADVLNLPWKLMRPARQDFLASMPDAASTACHGQTGGWRTAAATNPTSSAASDVHRACQET
jgi:hypothetical protein